jgi:hypothetical protein
MITTAKFADFSNNNLKNRKMKKFIIILLLSLTSLIIASSLRERVLLKSVTGKCDEREREREK